MVRDTSSPLPKLSLLTLALITLSVVYLPGCGSGSGSHSGGVSGHINAVNHIVFMLQENRSFDNYFGQLNQFRASQGLPQAVDGLTPTAGNPSFDRTSIVRPFRW